MNNKIHPIQEKILKLSESQDLTKLTLRDIGKFVNEPHPQKIKHHLDQLIKKKLISLNEKHSGNLIKKIEYLIANSSISLVNIPILGEVNCGKATLIADNENKGFLKVSSTLVRGRKEVFALKAVGNSMNKANINRLSIEDGDYILVDGGSRNPKNGDYVVSVIDDAANAKRIFFEPDQNRVVLISESKEILDPIVIHENDYSSYLVAGKIFNVIKTNFP